METADAFLQRLLLLPIFAKSSAYGPSTHPHLLLRPKGKLEHIMGKYPLLAFGSCTISCGVRFVSFRDV
jgi:hypothetical protein